MEKRPTHEDFSLIQALGNLAGVLAIVALGLTLVSRAQRQSDLADSTRAVVAHVQSAAAGGPQVVAPRQARHPHRAP